LRVSSRLLSNFPPTDGSKEQYTARVVDGEKIKIKIARSGPQLADLRPTKKSKRSKSKRKPKPAPINVKKVTLKLGPTHSVKKESI